MKDFSMYHYALAQVPAPVTDLGEVSYISHRDFVERPTFTFRAQVPCLEYVSLLIENALLLRTNRAGRVYTGFQKLSRMEAIVDRYLRIADVSERLYVFGEPDWKPPRHPHLRLIPVASDDRLAREWFVIADSSSMRAALVAQDQDGFQVPILEARHFIAIKTTDPALVEQLVAAAENLVDASLAM